MGRLIFRWVLRWRRRTLEATLAADYSPKASRQLDEVLFLLEVAGARR